MTTSTGSRLRGLEELWELRQVLQQTGPGLGLPLGLLEGVRRVIGCDQVEFNAMDSTRRRHRFWQGSTADGPVEARGQGDPAPEETVFWDSYWPSPCASYPDRSGDLATIVRRSDFVPDRQWLENPMYRDCLRPIGRYSLMMSLSDGGPGRTLRLIAFRADGHDFDDNDVFLLELLRPHIGAAHRRAQAHRAWEKAAVTTAGQPPRPRRTARQRQVLALVRDGATNAAIAHQLGIAEGTVRKHLEHIHATLGVSSRTAAAVAAEDLV